MGIEIERKFLIKKIPDNIEDYEYHIIEQGYLSREPVVRVRKQDTEYYMTYKGKGLLKREEYNLPLNESAYEHLLEKADGNIISKKRYIIPLEGRKEKVELDVFEPPFAPLVMAEVEFESLEASDAFVIPDWFEKEVTNDREYHNCNMAYREIQT